MPLDTTRVAPTVLVPLLVLWLPVVLTLWFRYKALAAPAEARASVWFWCFRYLRYLNFGTVALWWVATDSVGLKSLAATLWTSYGMNSLPASSAIFLLLFWTPPILVLILSQVLFRPVYARIRGIDWKRSDLARSAAFSLGTWLIPALCFIGGFAGLPQMNEFPAFALCCVLGIACAVFSARGLRKQFQLTPNALTTGELRDRAFSLAARLGVKLRQVYLLPPGKARLANAFARSGSSILLTEVLLTNLNKKEVDSVIGHELSHLKHDHPRQLSAVLIGGLVLVAVPYLAVSTFGLSSLFGLGGYAGVQPLFDLLFVCVPLMAFYFVARRFEYTADTGSVKLTGDPASMITALVKLHHLNLIPLEWDKWSEKAMTHPSTVRRAQSIGRAAGFSEAHIQELLATAPVPLAGSPCDYYALPGHSASAAGKVFSTAFKQRSASHFYLGFLAIAVILPSAILRGLDLVGWPADGFLAFLTGLSVCLVVSILFSNSAPFAGYRQLRRKLRSKFAAEGIPVESAAAILVGMSPGDAPRVFDSNYSWDTGYLLLFADRICYWGEEARFSLRREQITSLRLGEGIPGWFNAKFLYLTWRAAEGEPESTLNLRPIEVRSVLDMKRALNSLESRLSVWRTTAASAEALPAQLEALQPPQIGEVTSTSIYPEKRAEQSLRLFVLASLFSGVCAVLFHLPIEWVLPVSLVQDTSGYARVSGWYAILISLILLLFWFGPFWFARGSRESARVPVSPSPVPARKSNQSPLG